MTLFIKKLQGQLAARSGTDIYGEAVFRAATPVWVMVVHLGAARLKTSVRADTSGSRGRSDEPNPTGKILLERAVNPKVEDRFDLDGVSYLISHVEPRYAAMGGLDHWEVDLTAKVL